VGLLLLAAAAALPAGRAHALRIDLDPPAPREFVRDLANLVDDADERRLRHLCDKLLTEKATPVLVVTIESMAAHGGSGLRIETFARLLFDQWGVGHAELGGRAWNTGILLLVSRGDRRARIELGAGWKREKDALCQKIMDEQIIPAFKEGRFSAGIVAGVTALDRMARELKLPGRKRSWKYYAMIVGLIALAAFTMASLVRQGTKGWAWLLWGALFAGIGMLLYHVLTSSSRRGSSFGGGGGFSGGSFGGGFSGGGGASGSW
jgi:uncharacterized protein